MWSFPGCNEPLRHPHRWWGGGGRSQACSGEPLPGKMAYLPSLGHSGSTPPMKDLVVSGELPMFSETPCSNRDPIWQSNIILTTGEVKDAAGEEGSEHISPGRSPFLPWEAQRDAPKSLRAQDGNHRSWLYRNSKHWC